MYKNLRHESIFRIGHAIGFSDKSYFSVYKAKQRINFNDNEYIFFLSKGNVTAHSTEDNLLMLNLFAPEIIGMEKLSNHHITNYFRCVTDAEIYVIDKSELKILLQSEGLWANAFDVISLYYVFSHARISKLAKPTTKASVIEFIKYIWTLNPSQREETSIYTHIMDRTHISRSLIHKVVAELEREGLVCVKRGVLIDCNLP